VSGPASTARRGAARPGPSSWLVARTLLLITVAGIAYGWLFSRR
jgi:hypothetical protein